MKSDDFKKVVKGYVRQCLMEVLAEDFLQSVIKEAVSEGLKGVRVIKEEKSRDMNFSEMVEDTVEEVVSSRPQQREARPPRVDESINKLGVKDPLMRSIFEDTLRSNNPIVTGEQAPSSGEISEDALKALGVHKNWDKYIK